MTNRLDHVRRHFHAALESTSLKAKPCGVTILGTPLVIFRAKDGIVAAEDRCPHRNAPLSRGDVHDGLLRCPYHGWSFASDGRCVVAPGLCESSLPVVSLCRWQVREEDGLIWVAPPGSLDSSEIYRPEIVHDAAYRGFTMFDEIEADLADALENLLDGTHTPFVHAGLVRGEKARQRFTATVRLLGNKVQAEYRGESGQHGLISRWFEPPREASFGRFVPPVTAELEYRSRRRVELQVVARFTPSTAGRLRVFVTCYVPGGLLPAAVRWWVIRPFFRKVMNQDRDILRLQQQNIQRFGQRAYSNWPADLLRPWIDGWLRDGQFPSEPVEPQTIEFHL